MLKATRTAPLVEQVCCIPNTKKEMHQVTIDYIVLRTGCAKYAARNSPRFCANRAVIIGKLIIELFCASLLMTCAIKQSTLGLGRD